MSSKYRCFESMMALIGAGWRLLKSVISEITASLTRLFNRYIKDRSLDLGNHSNLEEWQSPYSIELQTYFSLLDFVKRFGEMHIEPLYRVYSTININYPVSNMTFSSEEIVTPNLSSFS